MGRLFGWTNTAQCMCTRGSVRLCVWLGRGGVCIRGLTKPWWNRHHTQGSSVGLLCGSAVFGVCVCLNAFLLAAPSHTLLVLAGGGTNRRVSGRRHAARFALPALASCCLLSPSSFVVVVVSVLSSGRPGSPLLLGPLSAPAGRRAESGCCLSWPQPRIHTPQHARTCLGVSQPAVCGSPSWPGSGRRLM